MISTEDWQLIRRTIEQRAHEMGFEMSALASTGEFLAALAAAKPGGRVLELGTGLGFGASWLLQGMSSDSTLVTIENDSLLSLSAREVLGFDSRIEFVVEDGGDYLEREARAGTRFDLVFADAWPGKFYAVEEALQLVGPGGFYVVDDLLPQTTWPDGHGANVQSLIETLPTDERFSWAHMDWASGILLGTRRSLDV